MQSPQQVESAALYQVGPGKSHHFANGGSLFLRITVVGAFATSRLGFEGTALESVDGVG